MKIDHIALWTLDLERSKAFYTRFFAGASGEKYHNIKTGFESYFVTFETGGRLELMHAPDIAEGPGDAGRPKGYAHCAFSVGSREAVDALTEVLRSQGYRIASEPRTTGDGYYESCVLDPDDNPVEITV